MQNGISALETAVSWCAGLFTGVLASSIAVLAVASLGFAMLQGSVSWRSGARIVLGCFILLGSNVLAKWFVAGARMSSEPVSPILGPTPNLDVAKAKLPAIREASDPFNPYATTVAP